MYVARSVELIVRRHGDKPLTGFRGLFFLRRTAFSVVNNAKFSSLFHWIYTNLDNLAPLDSINVEHFTQFMVAF